MDDELGDGDYVPASEAGSAGDASSSGSSSDADDDPWIDEGIDEVILQGFHDVSNKGPYWLRPSGRRRTL